jgi:spermidine synthase
VLKWYKKPLKYLTCFATGFVILVLELTAFRLLAPYYGVSNIITGIIINTILLALAVGYLLGGYVADKYKSEILPYLMVVTSTLYLMLIYAVYPPLMDALADQSVVLGASLTVTIMFFPPMALLAFIPPYFIKMISIQANVGKTAGTIYALSTLGSIAGGLCTTFLFIPHLGSQTTFLLTIILLLSIATLGLISFSVKSVSIVALAAPLLLLPTAESGKYVYKGESEYNAITIARGEGGSDLYLLLNDQKGFHSKTLNPDTMLSYDYYDHFVVAQLLVNTKHTLILGNGAGTAMMQADHFIHARVHGVEIDKQMTHLGQTYFGLTTGENLTITHADARSFLHKNRLRYDTIIIDIYAGGPYIPFHVTTVEFYQRVKQALALNGVVAVNLPFYALNTELSEYLLNTIKRVFAGSVYISGCVAFVFNTEIGSDELFNRFDNRAPAALMDLGRKVIENFQEVEMTNPNKVFTDDYAPVESMTYKILKTEVSEYADCYQPRNSKG